MNPPIRKDFPLNPGRIIRGQDVHIVPTPHEGDTLHDPPTIVANADVSNHEPEITVHKDGDRVKTIVVKCSCGRVISLDCEY